MKIVRGHCLDFNMTSACEYRGTDLIRSNELQVPIPKRVVLLLKHSTKFQAFSLLLTRKNMREHRTKRQFGTRLKEHQKAVFFCKKENSALSEHTCLTNHTIGWDKSKIITTNRRYHQPPLFGGLAY